MPLCNLYEVLVWCFTFLLSDYICNADHSSAFGTSALVCFYYHSWLHKQKHYNDIRRKKLTHNFTTSANQNVCVSLTL